MSDSTPDLTQISSAQSGKEVTANRNLNAALTMFGIEKIIGLSAYVIGGRLGGTHIDSATLTLTASATNYIVADRSTGALSVSTSSTNWNNNSNYGRVAKVVMGSSTYTSWEDHRAGVNGILWGENVTATASQAINAQTGTSYTVLSGDLGKLVTLSNTSAVAVSLPQATGSFAAGFWFDVENLNTGAVTITPTTSTIDGATTLVLRKGQSAHIVSNGTDWIVDFVDRGVLVNAQSGTSYTYVAADHHNLVTHSNAASIAGTLPQATGAFGVGFHMWVQNRGAGALTITPTTSTIDGAASLVLATKQGVLIVSDGTNYYTSAGRQIGGSTTQVQFNDGGVLAGDSSMVWDKTNKILTAQQVAVNSSNVNAQTGTSYTLLSTDNGKIVTLSNASSITLTVPSGLGAGFSCMLMQIGAGQVTIAASSTTLNAVGGALKISAQHGVASVFSYASDTFNVAGNLTV